MARRTSSELKIGRRAGRSDASYNCSQLDWLRIRCLSVCLSVLQKVNRGSARCPRCSRSPAHARRWSEPHRSEPGTELTHRAKPASNGPSRHSIVRRPAMPLKILGWGTMVGVAWLAISTTNYWMRPIQARAAQMVRFARSLHAPPYRSPVQRPVRPCPPCLPAVPRRTQSTTSATLRSSVRPISGRPLRRNDPPGWALSCEPLREHHGLPQTWHGSGWQCGCRAQGAYSRAAVVCPF